MTSQCDSVAERIALGEPLDDLATHVASCTRCQRVVEMPGRLGATRHAIDPGLGFAKEPAHSYEVLARLDEFAGLGRPLVVGASRKTFLTRPLGREIPAIERDWATAATVAASAAAGAHIVRVHAVKELAQVVRVADEIRKYHRASS